MREQTELEKAIEAEHCTVCEYYDQSIWDEKSKCYECGIGDCFNFRLADRFKGEK